MTGRLALTVAVLTVALLFAAAGRVRGTRRARPFAELLIFYPVLLAFVWLLVTTGSLQIREVVVGLILLVEAGWLMRHSPMSDTPRTWTGTRSTWLLDVGLIGLPLVVGLLLGQRPEPAAVAISILLYPLYALLQLILFLRIPLPRLRALGQSPTAATVTAAVLFALIHWPNPVVMVATLAGLLIWGRQYQRGRPLWQLAVVMGLAATTFSQGLPDPLTRHVQVGPGYVQTQAVAELARATSDSHAPTASATAIDAAYLDRIYAGVFGRSADADELARWLELLRRARRCTWAYMVLTSREYAARAAAGTAPTPPAPVQHWSGWPAPWRARLIELSETAANDTTDTAASDGTEAYLRGLYRELLDREASSREIAAWNPRLSVTQRRRLAEVLLTWRDHHGDAPVTGLDVTALALPN